MSWRPPTGLVFLITTLAVLFFLCSCSQCFNLEFVRPYGRGISRSDAAEHSVRCLRELLSRVGFGNLLCICSFSLWARALWLVCNIQLVDYQYVLYPKGGQGGRLNARLQVWMRGAAGDVQQWSEKKGRSPCNGACWCMGCIVYCIGNQAAFGGAMY